MKHIIRAYLVAALCCVPSSLWAQLEPQAIAGTVSGKVQQVGFRALILKQAIQYNLAGTAQNLDNGTVQFVLQGNNNRIDKALRRGTGKSSAVRVTTSPAAVDASLNTFRVIGWTSTSRKITTPRDLVFSLRPDDLPVSESKSKKIYQDILKSALK